MKRQCMILVSLMLFVGICSPVLACTSFAVYAKKPIYGMNFDYSPDVELRFVITSHGDINVFRFQFSQANFFADTAGMNSKGLFTAEQLVFPEPERFSEPGANTLFFWQLHNIALTEFDRIDQITELLSTKTLLQHQSVSLHNLFADKHGNAIVTEAKDDGNAVTKIHGKFHVMANFPVCEFADKSYEEVEGSGSKRYKIAYRYLLEHAENFDIDHGLALLQAALNTSKDYPTRCSMVFDPTEHSIYIALEGNFAKIWKVSLEGETIETFKGFDTSIKRPVNADGIVASELKKE